MPCGPASEVRARHLTAGLVPDIGVVWVDGGSGVAQRAGAADLAGAARARRRLGVGRRPRARRVHRGAAHRALRRPPEGGERCVGAQPHRPAAPLRRRALPRPAPARAGHRAATSTTSSSTSSSGPRFVVTLHGPRNPVVPLAAMVRETGEVAARMEAGRLRPRTPMALVYAHVAALTNVQERLVNDFAQEVGLLEQRVMAGRRRQQAPGVPRRAVHRAPHAAHRAHDGLPGGAGDGPRRDPGEAGAGGGPAAARGPARPVRPPRPDREEPARVPRGRHRLLPGPHRHPDDDRGRAPGGDRGDHACPWRRSPGCSG